MRRLSLFVACTMLGGCLFGLGVTSSNTKEEDWALYRLPFKDVPASDAYAWFVGRAKRHLCSIDRNPLPFRTGYGAYCHGNVVYFFATNDASVIIACLKPTTLQACYAHYREIVDDE